MAFAVGLLALGVAFLLLLVFEKTAARGAQTHSLVNAKQLETAIRLYAMITKAASHRIYPIWSRTASRRARWTHCFMA